MFSVDNKVQGRVVTEVRPDDLIISWPYYGHDMMAWYDLAALPLHLDNSVVDHIMVHSTIFYWKLFAS